MVSSTSPFASRSTRDTIQMPMVAATLSTANAMYHFRLESICPMIVVMAPLIHAPDEFCAADDSSDGPMPRSRSSSRVTILAARAAHFHDDSENQRVLV